MLCLLGSIGNSSIKQITSSLPPNTIDTLPGLSNLVAHYDFGDKTTLLNSSQNPITTNGEYVYKVLDKSGGGYNLTSRGNTGNVYLTSGLGLTKPCVSITGGNSTNCGYYTIDKNPLFGLQADTYIVLRSTTTGNIRIINKTNNNNVPYPFDIKVNGSNWGNGTSIGSSTGNIASFTIVQSVAVIFSTQYVRSTVYNINQFYNGTQIANVSGGAVSGWVDGNRPLYLCARSDNPGVSNFELGEMLLYNSPLSQSDREQIEGYLATKWNLQSSLPSSHPYYSTPLYYIGSQ